MPQKTAEARRLYINEYNRKNRVRVRIRQRKWREKNKDVLNAKKQIWKAANKEKCLLSNRKGNAKRKMLVIKAKAKGCKDCGESDIRVIELHAPKGHTIKNKNIGDGCRFSFKDLIAEIKKCIPLCANCHLKRHSKESVLDLLL